MYITQNPIRFQTCNPLGPSGFSAIPYIEYGFTALILMFPQPSQSFISQASRMPILQPFGFYVPLVGQPFHTISVFSIPSKRPFRSPSIFQPPSFSSQRISRLRPGKAQVCCSQSSTRRRRHVRRAFSSRQCSLQMS